VSLCSPTDRPEAGRGSARHGRHVVEKAGETLKDGYKAAQQYAEDNGLSVDVATSFGMNSCWLLQPRLRSVTLLRRTSGVFPERLCVLWIFQPMLRRPGATRPRRARLRQRRAALVLDGCHGGRIYFRRRSQQPYRPGDAHIRWSDCHSRSWASSLVELVTGGHDSGR